MWYMTKSALRWPGTEAGCLASFLQSLCWLNLCCGLWGLGLCNLAMLPDVLVCTQAWQKADEQVVNLQRSVYSPLPASGRTVIVPCVSTSMVWFIRARGSQLPCIYRFTSITSSVIGIKVPHAIVKASRLQWGEESWKLKHVLEMCLV